MKKCKIKSVVMIILIMSISNAFYAQHDHSKMKMSNENKGMTMHHDKNEVKLNDENLTKAYMHYTMIKEALVAANATKVQKASKMLVGILTTYGKALDAKEVASKLASSTDIKAQRILFSDLTSAFETLVKGNIVSGEIFKTFCPMANNGGAYWLSNSNTIVNPYLGKDMATCGSVKDTFKSM